MDQFKQEMSIFLRTYSLSDFSQVPNKWSKFLYLYACVIEDAPLIIRDDNPAQVNEVVVSVEMAKATVDDQNLFKVSWLVKDRAGNSDEIFVINSFC